jgi:hypothetical protein
VAGNRPGSYGVPALLFALFGEISAKFRQCFSKDFA